MIVRAGSMTAECSYIRYHFKRIVANKETDRDFRYGYNGVMLSEWLKIGLETAGISQAELARRLSNALNRSIDRAAVNKMTIDKRKISADEMLAIAEILKIAPPPEISRDLVQARAPVAELPIHGEVAAGRWLEIGDTDALRYEGSTVPVPPFPGIAPEVQFALVVRGTSLNRIASDGDVLVCADAIKSGVRLDEGDLVIVERRKFQGALREVTAKRLRKVNGGFDLWPESDDPRFQEPIRINSGDHGDEEVNVIAKVLWVMKKP